MMRLIEKGLMFGNLFEVSSTALVERYSRALKHLTGKQTKLTSFHIDISGFAPEIGDELDDPLYLNPNGCNRQFILLSTDQKTAPLLNAQFSTSRGILRQFIESNEAQLFALTAMDAVAGELVNSIYDISEPAKLLQIRQIEIEADTTEAHIESAEDLEALLEEFQQTEDGWWDDVLIAKMITLAKKSGDITRNPVQLNEKSFRQDNFHTSHFGGIYVFRDLEHPAAISVAAAEDLSGLPIDSLLDLEDRTGIAKFLQANKLVENIVSADNLDAAALLKQRLDFILVDTASAAGEDLTGQSRRQLRQVVRRHIKALPPEFHALNDLLRWVEDGQDWPEISSEHPAYFYTLRAAQHKDRDLVNMLLAELSPKDIRQLFICHKAAFYQAYHAWPATKKSYVADFLAQEYALDKAGTRSALFGPEPGMEDIETTTETPADIIQRVGPWGAVRKARPWV